MAMCVKRILKNSFNLLSQHVVKNLVVNTTRQLYAPISMGMTGYINARTHTQLQFKNVESLFLDKMKTLVDDKISVIYTEDLKTMLHILENKEEDLDLLLKLIKKFKNTNQIRFSNFVFGTVAMRAFYHLDIPDIALKAYLDPELDGFFDQLMSQQLLMDMLYNHGRYEDVRKVYDVLKSKNLYGLAHPKNAFILVTAACYKENTKESLDYAIKLFKEAQLIGYKFPRRSLTFIGGLALKQSNPGLTLEIITLCQFPRHIGVRCLKIEALALLKRYEDLIITFNNAMQSSAMYRRIMYFQDTLDRIEGYLKNDDSKEAAKVLELLNKLKLGNYVQEKTLAEVIESEIDFQQTFQDTRKKVNNLNLKYEGLRDMI